MIQINSEGRALKSCRGCGFVHTEMGEIEKGDRCIPGGNPELIILLETKYSRCPISAKLLSQ